MHGWVLESDDARYSMAVRNDGTLRHRFLSLDAIPRGPASLGTDRHLEDIRTDVDDWEYPARGPFVFQEVALAATFGPADRDLNLAYVEHEIDAEGEAGRLRVRLADRYHPLVVDLYYQVEGDSGVFRRWAVIHNSGQTPVTLEEAGSFGLHRPPGRYVLHHLTGGWANEMNPVSEALHAGRKVLESRRGYTGHVHQPWFALTEEGSDYTVFGALEWSGNWRLSFESDLTGRLAISGGMSGFDFAHVLEPGAAFATPAAVVGIVSGGLDEAGRALHRYIREFVLPRRPQEETLPIIFEGWYTTFGRDMGADRLIQEAHRVAELGVELFIVTAGWYTTGDWVSREGDWYARPELYPNGLEEVADVVRELGMRFGLWWEPEVVAEESEVYREHPEWVYQFVVPGPQPRHHRLVLNLGRTDVYQHVRGDIFRLARQYQLDYFRTDMNRPWSELGDPTGESGPGRDLLWRHINNYYRILDELRAEFPNLIIENCAGGGGRIDLGLLRRTDTTWISDNVNQKARLSMFMGGTSSVPPIVCEKWMVDWTGRELPEQYEPYESVLGTNEPQPDADFLFRVCMMGHMGIGADVKRWSADWTARAKHYIALYKELRRTIQLGDLYRLTPPPPRDGMGEWASAAFVAPDQSEAVAFCYRLASELQSFRVRIPGLESGRVYELQLDSRPERWQRSGTEIAEHGVEVVVPSRFSSALLIARGG
jgi:alpha-galactosidase